MQALNNVTGAALVVSHPLAGVAAIARRRSALQPLGTILWTVCNVTNMHYNLVQSWRETPTLFCLGRCLIWALGCWLSQAWSVQMYSRKLLPIRREQSELEILGKIA